MFEFGLNPNELPNSAEQRRANLSTSCILPSFYPFATKNHIESHCKTWASTENENNTHLNTKIDSLEFGIADSSDAFKHGGRDIGTMEKLGVWNQSQYSQTITLDIYMCVRTSEHTICSKFLLSHKHSHLIKLFIGVAHGSFHYSGGWM